MPDWQPIDTAPRDGRCILLASANEGWVMEGQWFDWRDSGSDLFGWTNPINYDDPVVGGELGPTHWMPLPEPPKAKGPASD